jgi:hypothetical protein
MTTYKISVFADFQGYAVMLVKQEPGELLEVVTEDYNNGIVSGSLLMNTVQKLGKMVPPTKGKYEISTVVHSCSFNSLPYLEKICKEAFYSESSEVHCDYFFPVELDIAKLDDESLKLRCLLIDKFLKVLPGLEKEIAQYNPYDKKVNRRVFALFVLIQQYEMHGNPMIGS